MSNYKDTLNLPTTDFPMKADLAKREPEILSLWQNIDLYRKLRKHCKGREKFVLHDGPPYANGAIHLGHALNKTLKDIIIKQKTLSGFDAPMVPGWDCHGLPVELNVEKKFGKAGDKISADSFREKCREYAQSQVIIQREGFKRLGILGDWEHPYRTMDYKYEANIIRGLGRIIKRGHLQQGFKPVYWCLDCHSSLAEAEVEYINKNSASIDVRFKILDTKEFFDCFGKSLKPKALQASIPIWTTTPWSLPGNEAVALHPDLNYVLIESNSTQGDEYFLIAEALITSCVTRFGLNEHKVIANALGKTFAGLQLQHPLFDRQVAIVLGEHVTTDAGTGSVHTAPGHGPDDYKLAIEYDLPISNPIANNGCFHEDVPMFAGIHVRKADEPIIEALLNNKNLIHFEKIEHSYPHCWRHKSATIFRATPQWFISMEKEHLRRDALTAIDQVSWLPSWGKERIQGMIEGRPDWCISRQRHWGVPIPLFCHKETNELHPDTEEIIERVAGEIEKHGIEAWFSSTAETFLGDEAIDYNKSMDTLDVWLDSGISHFCVLNQHKDLQAPANLYLEGSDQHRGWFQSSLLTSIAMSGTAPYLEVLTHGYTVDDKGYKMSKSRGNVVAPETVTNKYGADILRLWAAASDYRSELSFSDEIVKRVCDVYRRIRNTSRYLLSNLFDFDAQQHLVAPEDMLTLDRWVVDRCRQIQKEILKAYDEYQFHIVYQTIHHFCSIELGSFYLDIIKDRQYTTYTDGLARRSCQTAMYHILQSLVRWLAPILSFTAEEIWQHMPDKLHETVFFTTWYENLATLPKEYALGNTYWKKIIEIRNEINKHLENARREGVIGSNLGAEITLYCDTSIKSILEQLGDELRFVLITSEVMLLPFSEKPENIPETDIPSLGIHIHASTHAKCARCWHYRGDVGSHEHHPLICGRCIQNLEAPGEIRKYA